MKDFIIEKGWLKLTTEGDELRNYLCHYSLYEYFALLTLIKKLKTLLKKGEPFEIVAFGENDDMIMVSNEKVWRTDAWYEIYTGEMTTSDFIKLYEQYIHHYETKYEYELLEQFIFFEHIKNLDKKREYTNRFSEYFYFKSKSFKGLRSNIGITLKANPLEKLLIPASKSYSLTTDLYKGIIKVYRSRIYQEESQLIFRHDDAGIQQLSNFLRKDMKEWYNRPMKSFLKETERGPRLAYVPIEDSIDDDVT